MAWGGNDGAIDRWEKQLKESDPKLVSLHILSFRKVTTKELTRLFAAIAENTVLRDLYISGHALDEACADQLSETLTLNDTLKTLNLGNATLGNDTKVFGLICEGLAVNEGLIKLDLDNKGLKLDTVRLLADALTKNSHLKELNLTRNELDNEAIAVLAPACVKLENINLSMNHIGPSGAMALVKDLMPNGQVQELDLSDNPLLEGASQFVSALGQNKVLRVLKMVDVVSSGLDALSTLPPPAGAAEDDGKLTEETNEKGGERSVHGNALLLALGSILETNKQLTNVWLNNNSIESSALETVATHLPASRLVELALRNNLIDDQGALALSKAISNEHFRQLELGENNITAKGFGALLDTSLHYLGLFSNQVGGFGETPELLPDLKGCGIKRLDVGCNHIVHKDIEAMVNVLLEHGAPDLELLELGGNVEDKEMELWENTLSRLLSERDLEIIWKRKPSQMANVPPPPPPIL